ncbi:MAG TPA: hypothetical protein VMU29_07475 [Smithella sp.]|nr:hypothetical protein [Smithella sp.]
MQDKTDISRPDPTLSHNKEFIKLWPFVGLVLCLMIPSLPDVLKYLGPPGIVVYLLFVPSAVFFYLRIFLPVFVAEISEKQALMLTLVFMAGVAAVFFVVFPIANVHIPGRGSDSADGVNLAVKELINLRYPYLVRAYLGSPISELPGSLLLAMPFVIMGNSAYQNIFWIIVFCVFLKSYLGTWRQVFLLMMLIFVLSPVVDQQLVTGGPNLSNEIFIMLSTYLLVSQLSGANHSKIAKTGSAVFFGIAMSSKLNFVLIGPLLFSCLLQNSNLKETIKYLLISAAVWAIVTLPFYFYAPVSFTPFRAQAAHASYSILPFSAILLPLSVGLVSVVLAFRRMGPDCEEFFAYSAFVQGLLIVTTVILSNMATGGIDLKIFRYGIMFIFLGSVPCWRVLTRGMVKEIHKK